MKYLRTKNNIIYKIISEAKEDFVKNYNIAMLVEDNGHRKFYIGEDELEGSRQAETIEELIQLNDIVFYWQQSDDKEHCALMTYPREIEAVQSMVITKLLVPICSDYRCVAKAEPSFATVKEIRLLVKKGELELS